MSHSQSIKSHETGLEATELESDLIMPGLSAKGSAENLLVRIAEAQLRLAKESNLASLITKATEQLRHLLKADRVLLVRTSTPEMGFIEHESVRGKAKLLSGLHCEPKYLFPFERVPTVEQTYWLSSIESGDCFRIDPSSSQPLADGPSSFVSCNPFHLLMMHNLGHSSAIHFFIPSKREVPSLLSCYFKEASSIPSETLKNAQFFAQWLLNRLEELNAIKTHKKVARLRSVRLAVRSEAPEKYSHIWEQFDSIAPSLLAQMTGCNLTLLGPERMHTLGRRLNESSRTLLYKWLEHKAGEQETPFFCQGSRELDLFWPSWAESMIAFPVSSWLDRLWLILSQSKPQGSILRPLNQSFLKRTETAPAIGSTNPLKLPTTWPDAVIEHLRESAAFLSNSRMLRQRLLSESRLRESEARREAIIASIPEIIAMVDSQYICQDIHVPPGFANPLIDKNCLGLCLVQILPERYREEFVKKFEAALNPGEAGRVVVSLSKAGETLHYEICLARSGASEVIISVREQTKLIESLKRNKLLSLVARRSRSAIVLTDPEKRIHWVNAAFEELSGYSETEILGCTPSMLQGDQTDSATIARINQGLREENPVRETILNYKKDGSKYWVRLEISPYYKKNGSLEGFSGVQVDVTELVAQREMLQQSLTAADRLNQLIETAGRLGRLGHWEIFTDGSPPAWSPMTYEIYEIPKGKTLTTEDAVNAYAPEYRKTVLKKIETAIRDKTGFELEAEIITLSAKRVWIRAVGIPVFDLEGNVSGMRGAFQDIDASKRTAEALKSSQEELSLIYENSPVGLLLKGADGRWLRANQEFLRQIGLTNYPWAGKTNMEISRDFPEMSPLLESCQLSDAQTWQQRQPLIFEEKITLSTLGDLFFEVRKCPLYDEKGRRRGIILVSQDITQRKRAETRTLQSAKRKAIEQMAGGIAHDFNNFLTSIGMSAEFLLQDQSLSTKTHELVQTIQLKAQAANHVARQLLAFTKPQPLHAEPVDMENLLEECFGIALSGSAAQYSLIFEHQPFSFPTDPNLLLQVMTNLILNARQAQKDKGSVSITVGKTKDGRLRISVADEGPGIPPEEADRIFDPYFSTKDNGSGLGLHVVSTIVSRLKGTIELDRAYQKGACFILKIPPTEITATAHKQTDSPDTNLPGSDHLKTQILLLEDDPEQVDLLTRFFESLGLDYNCFSDGALLCRHVKKMKETDREQLCCLLDITVTTGLGALDILSSLRKAAPHADIILISGYTNKWKSNHKLLKETNASFLPKPYSLADLKKKITKSD